MQVSNIVLYGAIEAFVLVCVICLVLLIYIGKVKRRNRNITQQAKKLVSEIKHIKSEFEKAKQQFSVGNSYKKQINDQLLLTREYHKTLKAGQDIALDLNPESPLPRQAAALRHAILIAEKEALHSSQDGAPSWKILESKFQQLLQFYADFNKKAAKQEATEQQPQENPDADAGSEQSNQVDQSKQVEELQRTLEGMLQELGQRHDEVDKLETDLETTNKRIQNLEKFKKLFFEMEDQWKQAKQEAKTYYERLMSMRGDVKDQKGFDTALNSYNNVYKEIEKTILSVVGEDDEAPEFTLSDAGSAATDKPKLQEDSTAFEIHNSEKRALEELKKLRNLTADQHRIISQLQKKLEQSKTVEEKTAAIEQLQIALSRQVGYVKESEQCIQLLENELSHSMRLAGELQEKLNNAQDAITHAPKMQDAIKSFAVESKEMPKRIAELEREKSAIEESSETPSKQSEQQLQALQEQLQDLQGQYAELEARYLEARAG